MIVDTNGTMDIPANNTYSRKNIRMSAQWNMLKGSKVQVCTSPSDRHYTIKDKDLSLGAELENFANGSTQDLGMN